MLGVKEELSALRQSIQKLDGKEVFYKALRKLPLRIGLLLALNQLLLDNVGVLC